jgi:hypothetical protein
MKKQKISLQLRKQKISSLSEKQIQGGAHAHTFTTLPNPIPVSFVVIVCATKYCDIKESIKYNCDALTITHKC